MNTETLQADSLGKGDNTRITDVETMVSPKELIDQIPMDADTANFIRTSRIAISEIIHLKDDRLLVITGPCSIHNPEEALQIAQELKTLQEQNPHLYIVMRTYFEKPRTTIGWKGLLNDPDLDDSCDIEKGLRVGRELLMKINKMGVPTAVEFLDMQTPQYIADLVHWGAIGARTTESQEHRKLVSGLSMPVGFKNGTEGSVQIAIDAIGAANGSHKVIGTTKEGQIARFTTTGNPDGHVILRGSSKGANYTESDINSTIEKMNDTGITQGLVVDFSHANSNKDHTKQPIVCDNIATQISEGNTKIIGVMIEANIGSGAQKYTPGKDNPNDINPGISITDKCVDLETNASMLETLEEAVKKRKNNSTI